jgi:hypothetical protein
MSLYELAACYDNYWRLGMGALAIQVDERVKDVRFTEDTISVDLMDGRSMDGRSITVPLVW